jgi:hypothetical protein
MEDTVDIEMKFRLSEKKSVEEYRKNIEKMINALMPRVDMPMAITGFLLAVSGTIPIFIVLLNSSLLKRTLSPLSLVVIFLSIIASFFGYMLIHKSTERDWL